MPANRLNVTQCLRLGLGSNALAWEVSSHLQGKLLILVLLKDSREHEVAFLRPALGNLDIQIG